ncbi:MAG TPA: tetratricopeptide repeat protein [Myxococcota bacterium]|nr:tetratricopeptide repeat protein [Myxococcota bacterium]
MTKSLAKTYGTPWVSRIFYGWEQIKVKLYVSNVIDSTSDKDCKISVKDSGDWLKTCRMRIINRENGRIVYNRLWDKLPRPSGRRSEKLMTTISPGESTGGERIILPVDHDGSPLEKGIYTVKVICDMDALVPLLHGTTSKCNSILKNRNIVGNSVVEIIKPSTRLERAEEEMHKAFWLGIYTPEAIPHLLKVLEYDPKGRQAMEWLSGAYIKTNEMEKAKKIINRCIEANPYSRACKNYRKEINM